MDQSDKVASPARGQTNREHEHFPVPARAWEFGLARRVRPSRPASACSFSTLRLNLVLTHGIPPAFRGDVHSFIPPTAIRAVPSLSGNAIAYRWPSLPTVRRHTASSPHAGSHQNGKRRVVRRKLRRRPTLGGWWLTRTFDARLRTRWLLHYHQSPMAPASVTLPPT